MNKAELIDAIAADASITKADAKRALDAFVGETTKALKKGDRVALVGFGSFSVANALQEPAGIRKPARKLKLPLKRLLNSNLEANWLVQLNRPSLSKIKGPVFLPGLFF